MARPLTELIARRNHHWLDDHHDLIAEHLPTLALQTDDERAAAIAGRIQHIEQTSGASIDEILTDLAEQAGAIAPGDHGARRTRPHRRRRPRLHSPGRTRVDRRARIRCRHHRHRPRRADPPGLPGHHRHAPQLPRPAHRRQRPELHSRASAPAPTIPNTLRCGGPPLPTLLRTAAPTTSPTMSPSPVAGRASGAPHWTGPISNDTVLSCSRRRSASRTVLAEPRIIGLRSRPSSSEHVISDPGSCWPLDQYLAPAILPGAVRQISDLSLSHICPTVRRLVHMKRKTATPRWAWSIAGPFGAIHIRGHPASGILVASYCAECQRRLFRGGGFACQTTAPNQTEGSDR